jgi:hypothetical protein
VIAVYSTAAESFGRTQVDFGRNWTLFTGGRERVEDLAEIARALLCKPASGPAGVGECFALAPCEMQRRE